MFKYLFLLSMLTLTAQNVDYKGAGFLLYTVINGKPHILIGQEGFGKNKNIWSSFGGRREKDEHDPLITAARECSEETRAIFGNGFMKRSIAYIKKQEMITAQKPLIFVSKGKSYVLYIAQVIHIPAEDFLKAAKIYAYEKINYKWVPVSALKEIAFKKQEDIYGLSSSFKQELRYIFETRPNLFDSTPL